MLAQFTILLFAAWLLVSPWVLPMAPAAQAATQLIAVLMAVFAAIGFRRPGAMLVDLGLAAFLAIAAVVVPWQAAAVAWHHVVVALIVGAAAVAPFLARRGAPRGAHG
jgi:hypothetical protein